MQQASSAPKSLNATSEQLIRASRGPLCTSFAPNAFGFGGCVKVLGAFHGLCLGTKNGPFWSNNGPWCIKPGENGQARFWIPIPTG